MTNEELRQKIIEALKQGQATMQADFNALMNEAFKRGAKHFGNKSIDKSWHDYYADALIAAGLTFDGEYKNLYKEEKTISQSLRGTSWQFKGWYEEQKHRAEVAEKAARDLIAYYCGYTIQKDIDNSLRVALQQAEKELAEERKE